MIPCVVIASRRDDGDWADLDLCVRSLAHYAPQLPVLVAWQGPEEPDVPHAYLTRQPDTATTYGAAHEFAVSLVHADLVLVCNDDVVVCPDTWPLLSADYDAARSSQFGPPGFVAAQANYARPTQRAFGPAPNARPAAVVSPYFALVERDALPERWPDCNWYSDDVMCADMADAGRIHWISRAYVHHIGERSTGSDHDALDAAGRAWTAAHRPDLAGRF